jgi:hypothetical protein
MKTNFREKHEDICRNCVYQKGLWGIGFVCGHGSEVPPSGLRPSSIMETEVYDEAAFLRYREWAKSRKVSHESYCDDFAFKE